MPEPTPSNLASTRVRAPWMERLCQEQRDRWQRGERVLVETYLAEQPALQTDSQAVLDLLYQEVLLREERGEKPQAAEYVQRFPAYQQQIEKQFLVHQALASTDSWATQTGLQPATAPVEEALVRIGKYRVVETLGSGGQGDVFRAIHPTLARDVVIKWARHNLPEDLRQKLVEEGRVLAHLKDDRGLVQVHDVDVWQDRPFMVLEYVAGRSLAQQLKQERPAFRAAALLVAQVAQTLERVHEQGVLHRDLKPANILIDGAGQPRLLDFGLACVTPQWSDSNPPEEGVSGTLQYMAPEQAAGHVEQLGPRSDVFGLGAVLYHLLTGRPPYQGTDLRSVWEQARQGVVTPVRQLNPRVPRRLERICMKALARDPGQRYGTAGEMARALHGYLGRRRVMAAALGLLGVAALGILVVVLGPGKRSTPPATVPAPAAPAALSGDLVVRVWTPGGGKRGLKVGEDMGALPVRNGEQVHLEAHVNQPAYLYVLWVDSRGHVDPLYPWERSFAKLPASPQAQAELHSPPQRDRGWPMEGPSGLETALLLVRRTPLPADVNLAAVAGQLQPAPLRDPLEVAVRGYDPGQDVAAIDQGEHRGLGQEAQQIDEPLLQLMERLRPHFEMIRAVRFAHRGD